MGKSLDDMILEARRECEAERLQKKLKRYSDDEAEELMKIIRELDSIEER